jgi:transcriptional regulator with XRE-family HTH domain
MNLGLILRKIRKEKGMTLKQVAEKSSISEGFLSQVENDVSSPSVATLVNICNAMATNVGEVISAAEKKERLVVIRKAEWMDVEIPSSGFVTRRFFAPESREVIDSSVVAMEPGSSIPGRKNLKHSQEILCVLTGAVELICGAETTNLFEGDIVHYYWSAPERQMITNKSNSLAVVTWVGTL